MPWLSHSLKKCLSQKSYYRKENSREGETENNKLFQCQGKGDEVQETEKKIKEDLGTRVG